MCIDSTKLTRNFELYPIQEKEDIDINDITYLFIELNLTKGEVREILGCSLSKVQKFIKQYKLTKTTKQIAKSQQNMNMRKYGVTNMMKLKHIADRCKDSYNSRTKEQRDATRQKTKQTCIDKYGVSNVSKAQVIKDKKNDTFMKHYGVNHANKTEEVKNKIKDTTIKTYGGFPFQKHSTTHIKYKKTIYEKYGVDNVMKNASIQTKTSSTLKRRTNELKQINLERIGVEWPSQLPETINKISASKRANKTFNSSRQEQLAHKKLLTKFPDVIYQYKCSRYPFNCDFYIPCLDLFIELNYFWMHGFMPYDENNDECIKQLEVWKAKAVKSKCYRNAIKTWVVRDVTKINTAIASDLNYLRFYDIQSFNKWYDML